MNHSHKLSVHGSRSQNAYLGKIQLIAVALSSGSGDIACPRDGCEKYIQASSDGPALILRCPSCGIIFRGSRMRLLAGIV